MGEEVSTVETEQETVVKQSRSPLVPPPTKSARDRSRRAKTNVSSPAPPVKENEKRTHIPDNDTSAVNTASVTVSDNNATPAETEMPAVTVGVGDETRETGTTASQEQQLGKGNIPEADSPFAQPESALGTPPPTGPTAVVQFDGVVKTYKTPHGDVHALSDVTFSVNPGDFVFLVGASGSGKSTILRLLIKEENVTEGSIAVASANLGSLRKRDIPVLRQQVGTVFQDFRLLADRTIFDNVAFGLKVLGRPSSEIVPTVTEVLHLVGLGDKSDRYPNELSGGEQQRAAIARAFASNPALLIADEPTGNLDPDTADGIIALLHAINLTGTTVIMATHDSRIVDALAKRVIRLDKGRIVSDETHGDYAGVSSTEPLSF